MLTDGKTAVKQTDVLQQLPFRKMYENILSAEC